MTPQSPPSWALEIAEKIGQEWDAACAPEGLKGHDWVSLRVITANALAQEVHLRLETAAEICDKQAEHASFMESACCLPFHETAGRIRALKERAL